MATEKAILENTFCDKNVLITGGLGFIGSHLGCRLVEMGANVLLVDAMLPGYGGNLYNIEPAKGKARINYSDIRDKNVMNYLVQEKDFIFHLAAQVSHILSLTNPFPDIDINIKGTAILMEACKEFNPEAKVVRTGTRGQYGSVSELPVSEDAAIDPKGIHEVSLMAAEKIMKIYNDIHGIACALLRLTNIYGPHAQMRHSQYGVANWFIRLSLDDKTIPVFGDGQIKRDFLYVDDCIEAILSCAACDNCYGEIINVGSDIPHNFLEMAKQIVEIAGSGGWKFAPFSPERKAQEPGDFYSDISKIRRLVGWKPVTDLEKGLQQTIEFYRKNKEFYW